MHKPLLPFFLIVSAAYLHVLRVDSKSQTPSYEYVVQGLQEKLSYLEQKVNVSQD